jgi:hypothetical protein
MSTTDISNGLQVETSVFLHPESMITPGVAGGLTMMITNTLCGVFVLPVPWVGLGISALFGLLVIAATTTLWKRMIFYVLNTLVVFCMAMGSANLAFQIAKPKPGDQASLPFISVAHAQDNSIGLNPIYLNKLQDIFDNPALNDNQRAKAVAELNAEARRNQWPVIPEPGDPTTVAPLPLPQNVPARGGFFKQWSIQ